MLFWNKVLSKLKEYWQVVLGLAVGLGVAVKLWWQLRSQKKVLENEIETTAKILEAEEDYDRKVINISEIANKKKQEKVKQILEKQEKQKEIIKKQLEDRVTENNKGSNEELAEKIANSFNVDVVLPEASDE